MQQPITDIHGQKVVAWHNLREMTAILVRQHGLHEGLYDLAIEFQISVGAVGPDATSTLPGSMIGVKNIGIVESAKVGPSTVNAAEVNPIVAAAKVAGKKATEK